jgi:hypothetical protein
LVEPEKPNKLKKPDKPIAMNQSAITEEQLRMGRLKRIVDITAYWLEQGSFNHDEALSIIEHARGEILNLCPGKEDVFDLVIRSRFLRIINERALSEWSAADSIN